jgi:hypothetical protein
MSRLRQVKLYLGTYKSHSTAIKDTCTNPLVSSDRLQNAATALKFAVQRWLRLRNNYLSITFDADVYRHCFGLSTNKLVYENDFEKLPLASGWCYHINKRGTGVQLSFPVRLKHRVYYKKRFLIGWSGSVDEKTLPTERLILISALDVFKV